MDHFWRCHSRPSGNHGHSRTRIAVGPNRQSADLCAYVRVWVGDYCVRVSPPLTHAPNDNHLSALLWSADHRSSSARASIWDSRGSAHGDAGSHAAVDCSFPEISDWPSHLSI